MMSLVLVAPNLWISFHTLLSHLRCTFLLLSAPRFVHGPYTVA